MQLDLAALPGGAERHGPGLLQLFYCTADDCPAEGWSPFAGGKLVRVVDPAATDGGVPPVPPAGVELMPAREITGWRPVDDWPSWGEIEDLGVRVEWLKDLRRMRVAWPEGNVTVDMAHDEELEAIAPCATGDKLEGWPAWVQGVEYPACPRCGEPMTLLFQVDSEDHVPWMFGDAGCGHVTRCRNHPDVVAFGWACC